jgi:hypothetical protein
MSLSTTQSTFNFQMIHPCSSSVTTFGHTTTKKKERKLKNTEEAKEVNVSVIGNKDHWEITEWDMVGYGLELR